MITYLKKLTDERDSLTSAATDLTEKAATEERDLTDTEKASLTAWSTRCAEIDGQLTEYGQQAESQRAYARLRESLTAHDEPERPSKGNGSSAAPVETRGWGDLVVESAEFRNYHGSGSSQRVEVPWESRAALALADFPTALKRPYLHTTAQYRESTPLLDAIPQITVSSNSVEWVRWAPNPVPAASVVAEGAPKPEMALTATAVSDTLETYAHWKGITRQALEDIPQVRSIIESRLRQGLARALDIAATTALNAGTYTGVSNADMLTGIRLGLATVQAQGYGTPASVVLNPADLAAIDISIMGSTMSGPQLNNSVWGLNFIPTPGVAVGTAYVGDLGSAVQLFRRANAAIYLTDSHGEFFISNIVLILAEIRASVAVSEPAALVEVTET